MGCSVLNGCQHHVMLGIVSGLVHVQPHKADLHQGGRVMKPTHLAWIFRKGCSVRGGCQHFVRLGIVSGLVQVHASQGLSCAGGVEL